MSLDVIRTADPDLTRVQQNVAKELAAVASRLPTKKRPSTPITTDYTVQLTDVLVLAKPEADINVTLPDVATCVGEEFTVKNLSSNAIVHLRGLYALGAWQAIDEQERYDVPSETSVSCYSDGKKWWIV